jgi:hypothetical protein
VWLTDQRTRVIFDRDDTADAHDERTASARG